MAEIELTMAAMQAIATAEDAIMKAARKQLLKTKDAAPAEGDAGQLKLTIKDCVDDEDRLTFVVEKGQLGLALGREARNLTILRNLFGKDVKIIEYDEDVEKFIRNLFKPHTVEAIQVETGEDQLLRVRVAINAEEKGKAIGKGGKNVKIVRTLAKRHHNIEELKVE